MLGSRVSWQLFLGWALLLGQPVFGAPDASKEAPVEEPEATEETVPVSQEPEEPEPGELPPGLETREFLRRELASEEAYMLLGPSEKELEEQEREERQWLEISRDHPHSSRLQFMKGTAMQHHSRQRGYIYKLYENTNIKMKKAIGTMVYLKLLLVKTNCTKEEAEVTVPWLHHRMFRGNPDTMNDFLNRERKLCTVPPESEQQIEECTFTLFHDARKDYLLSVTDQHCVPFPLHKTNY